MRISGENKNKLYSAVADKIMDLRAQIISDERMKNPEFLDQRLFKLEQQIWDGIKVALKINTVEK